MSERKPLTRGEKIFVYVVLPILLVLLVACIRKGILEEMAAQKKFDQNMRELLKPLPPLRLSPLPPSLRNPEPRFYRKEPLVNRA